MKKKFIFILLVLCIISGCGKEEYIFPGEDNINAYVYRILEIPNLGNSLSDYQLNPSIEDLFMNAFKTKILNMELEYIKEAMSEDGVCIDSKCVDYMTIGGLSAICEGNASLYIDEQLINMYITNEKTGNSYLQLSNDLTKRIVNSVMSPTWSTDSIRGKRLRISFYMNEEDWVKAVAEKDPFKYLAIDVKITDD